MVFGGVTIRNSIDKNRQELVAQKQVEQDDAEATRLVEGLLQADTSQVKAIIGNLADYRQYAKDDLQKAFAESPDDSNAKLHAALAMLPQDQSVLPFLKERLLTVSPAQFQFVRDLLSGPKDKLVAGYWEVATDTSQTPAQRFQAGCALASFDPHNELWQDKQFAQFITGHLVGVLPSELVPWRNALRTVKTHLTASLAAIYRDPSRDTQVRGFAADTLADYLSDDAEGLFDLLADANEKQFAPMFGKLSDHREKAIALGNAEVNKSPVKDASEAEKELLAMRQANAAVMLLKMDAADQVWPLLKHSPDPRVRSYIIHWLGPRGGDAKTIIARYEQETDVTIKRALLLCLGEFELNDSQKQPLIETLLTVYRNDPDAGLHGAAEWLLRKWRVSLPELPVGMPTLSEDQKQNLAELKGTAEDIKKQLLASEQQLPDRQLVWERTLAEQTSPPKTLNEGLAVHIPFDETQGTHASLSIEEAVGKYEGPGSPEWVPGVIGNAVRLNGEGGYFNFGNAFDPERTNAFSYGCWFLKDQDLYLGTLLAKMESMDQGLRGFDLFTAGVRLEAHLKHKYPDNWLVVATTEPVSTDAWHHVFVVYDGSSSASGLRIYLDGQPVSTFSKVNSLSKTIRTNAPVHIGKRNEKYPFKGKVDDVRIYDRSLDDEEVRQLFLIGLRSLVRVPFENRSQDQQRLLAMTYHFEDEPLQNLNKRRLAAEQALHEARLGSRRWYINTQGQTFVILDAGVFQMGSHDSEAGRFVNEQLHRRKIGRRFAISTKEVTRRSGGCSPSRKKGKSGRRIRSN